MLKTCAKPVGGLRITSQQTAMLSTCDSAPLAMAWINPLAFPRLIHNFFMQLCTPNLPRITSVGDHLSPFSTALIMSTNILIKEKLIIGSGG